MRAPPLDPPPVVLSAPSGAGKTTIAQTLVEEEEDFAFSVSATTRGRREAEIHGVDYWFLGRQEFEAMVGGGELAEWAEVQACVLGVGAVILGWVGVRALGI